MGFDNIFEYFLLTSCLSLTVIQLVVQCVPQEYWHSGKWGRLSQRSKCKWVTPQCWGHWCTSSCWCWFTYVASLWQGVMVQGSYSGWMSMQWFFHLLNCDLGLISGSGWWERIHQHPSKGTCIYYKERKQSLARELLTFFQSRHWTEEPNVLLVTR